MAKPRPLSGLGRPNILFHNILLGGLFIFVIGLSVGSFVNVLLYRWPRKKNFINSRSRCPYCSFKLEWFDLIPLVSFALLRGRCRNCRHWISATYPLVELLAGTLAVALFWFFRQDLPVFVFWFVVLQFLMVLFLFDLEYFILPDVILAALLIFILAYKLITLLLGSDLKFLPWQNIFPGLILLVLLSSVWFFSRGKWLGLGDVKYGFLIGLIFGSYGAIFIMYASILIGGGAAFLLLVFKKAKLKTKLPLGAFISIASVIYIFEQATISTLIKSLLL